MTSATQIAEAAIQSLGVSQDDAIIAQLAEMSPLEYERVRKIKAEELGLRIGVLDDLVAQGRKSKEVEEAPFSLPDPWPEPVDGGKLVSELVSTFRRFCVLPEHSDIVMAFWVLHAHAHEAADISPTLAFTSPEKRCGKTTALSVVSAAVPKPMHAVNISPAVMFRVVENYKPTVLIDEGDTFLAENDELRGILNGGHNRLTAFVWRSVGDEHEPRRFKVWAPKCIAMIGHLPDTLEDRSLVVPLRRKQDGESVERFRGDRIKEFEPLARRAARWAQDNLDRLKSLDPDLPQELNDRAQDNARALVAIADCVGGDWPKLLRKALVGLAGQKDDEPKSAGVLLLRDIAEIAAARPGGEIGTTNLIEELCRLEDSPWAEWRRSSPITARGVAKLLKPYGIQSRRKNTYRYYQIADFEDAFDRYLADTPPQASLSVTSGQAAENKTKKGDALRGVYSEPTSASVTRSQASPYLSPKNKEISEGYRKVTSGDACSGVSGERGNDEQWEGGF